MEQRIRDILTELREHFQRLYGPRLVKMILYGSQARGDAEEGSDIDVLVVLEDPVDVGEEIARTGGIVASLSLRNDCLIGCAFVCKDDLASRSGAFLRNVHREGVAI
jgi:predicted nucleotidyltransferase